MGATPETNLVGEIAGKHIRSPGLHDRLAALVEIGTSVGALDRTGDAVRQTEFGNLTRYTGLSTPVAK